MSGKELIFNEIENYNCEKLAQFLEHNGLDEFTRVVQIKNVDGRQFLNVTDFEISRWKPHVTTQQARRLWQFITKLKENPGAFALPSAKSSQIKAKNPEKKAALPLPRPNITKEQLEHLCNDEEIINKLQDLLRERDRQKLQGCDKPSSEETPSSDVDEAHVNQEVAFKLKINPASQNLKLSDSQNHLLQPKQTTPNASTLYSIKNQTSQLLPPKAPSPNIQSPKVVVTEVAQEALPTRPKQKSFDEQMGPKTTSKSIATEGIYEDATDAVEPNHFRRTRGPLLPGRPTILPVHLRALPKIPQDAEEEEVSSNSSSKTAKIPPARPKQNPILQKVAQPRKEKPEEPTVWRDQTSKAQFLVAKSHLESLFSQTQDEVPADDYLEPTSFDADEQVYEPEPHFEERHPMSGKRSIQNIPLPPIPQKFDGSELPLLRHSEQARDVWASSGGAYDPTLKSPGRSVRTPFQVKTLPKPSLPSLGQQVDTRSLPRPPKVLPTFDIGLNEGVGCAVPLRQSGSTNLESLFCYRYTDRKGSEMLLTEDLEDGAYLFRPSKQYHCTLSVRCENKIYHIGIEEIADGKLECLSSGRRLLFNNIVEICEHFKLNPLRIIDTHSNYKSVILRDVLPEERT